MPSAHRVDAQLALSQLYQQEGNWVAARQSLEAAVREALGPLARSVEEGVLPRSLLTALTEKAHFLHKVPASNPDQLRRNKQEALLAYEQAIDLTSALRRGALLTESKQFLAAKAAPLYTPALSLCYELAQQPGAGAAFHQRAFALFEKKQNSLLADSQLEKQLVRQYLPISLGREFQQHNARLSQLRLLREKGNSSLEAQLTKAEQELIAWQQRVSQSHPAYGQTLRKVSQLSMNEYQSHLAPGEVLLCYEPTPQGLLVMAVSHKTSTFRRVPISQATLGQAVAQFRSECSRDPGIVGAYDARPARQLYRILLAPVQEQIAKATGLTILAPPNWQFPFEALEARADRPLILEYDIAYQFNLSSRLLPTDVRPAQHQALSMAPFGADTGRYGFRLPTGHLLKPLRASADESSLLDGVRRLGKEASKARFLADAPNTRILLLTTHTLPGERETALVFHPSGSTPVNYLLFPSEIQNADLRAVELATLSACATEKGVHLPGDGINSLGRAMSWAGAKTVTCSFFDVHDEANALLARYFYPRLADGQPIRQTLRQARLDFLASPEGRRFSGHPFYWASLAVYGGHNALAPASPWEPWAWGLVAYLTGMVGWIVVRRKFPARVAGF